LLSSQFTNIDRDFAHLIAISEFEALGYRFDGVAVDIESPDGVLDHVQRSDKVVELSRHLRNAVATIL
jgi:hypothetical protein